MLEFLNNGWFLIITPGKKNFKKKCHCNTWIHSLNFPMIFCSSVSWVFSVSTKGLKGSEPTVWCTMWRWGCRCTRIHSSAFHLHSTYPETEQVVRLLFIILIIITSLMCNKKKSGKGKSFSVPVCRGSRTTDPGLLCSTIFQQDSRTWSHTGWPLPPRWHPRPLSVPPMVSMKVNIKCVNDIILTLYVGVKAKLNLKSKYYMNI